MISRIIKGVFSFCYLRGKGANVGFCSIYVELADQYKDMDAVSNVRKRNILAQHLREVVDILEQKVFRFLSCCRGNKD